MLLPYFLNFAMHICFVSQILTFLKLGWISQLKNTVNTVFFPQALITKWKAVIKKTIHFTIPDTLKSYKK